LNSTITDGHLLVPVCDEDGSYEAVQCGRNDRYCWCVIKKTGIEIEGTRLLNARPNCGGSGA